MSKLQTEILKLKERGFSYNEISKKLNCSKGTISYYLGAGQHAKNLERQSKRRSKIQKFLAEYKAKHNCADCKEKYPYWIMEFDHLRDKSFGLGNFRQSTISLERVKEEIQKCEVVCANCHRNRTFQRQTKNGDGIMFEFCKDLVD